MPVVSCVVEMKDVLLLETGEVSVTVPLEAVTDVLVSDNRSVISFAAVTDVSCEEDVNADVNCNEFGDVSLTDE